MEEVPYPVQRDGSQGDPGKDSEKHQAIQVKIKNLQALCPMEDHMGPLRDHMDHG
ncbi:MMPL family transporter [Sesbania bispinosa]|nr:MMPL family transporter [Sesbania bispinosa]